MSLIRAYQKLDGTVAILRPNPRLRREDETDAEFMARIAAQDAPKCGLDGLPFEDLEEATLPTRHTRKNWELRGKVVKEKGKP